MTIQEALTQADALQPGAYSVNERVGWLDELDKMIYWQIIRKANIYPLFRRKLTGDAPYMAGDGVMFKDTPYLCSVDGTMKDPEESPEAWTEYTFDGYTETTDQNTLLLVPIPYDIPLYTHWLMMKASLYNREINHYNSQTLLFQNAYNDYQKYMIRTHLPIQGATHHRL